MFPNAKIFAFSNLSPIKGTSDLYCLAVFKGLNEREHQQILTDGAKRIETTDIKIVSGEVIRRTVQDAEWREDVEHVYLVPRSIVQSADRQSGFIKAVYGEVTTYAEDKAKKIKGYAWCSSKKRVIKRLVAPADEVMTFSGNVVWVHQYLNDMSDGNLVLVPSSFENRDLPRFSRVKTKSDYILTSARAWCLYEDTIVAHLPDHKTTRKPHPNIRPLFARVVETTKSAGITYNDIHLTDSETDKTTDIYQIALRPTELRYFQTQKNKRPLEMPYQLDKLTIIVGFDRLNDQIHYDRINILRGNKDISNDKIERPGLA